MANKSEQSLAKKLRSKSYVFTVTDSESFEKPIIWCKNASQKDLDDQDRAEKLIEDWFIAKNESVTKARLKDLAYTMRKNGAAWYIDQFCFEMTEIN